MQINIDDLINICPHPESEVTITGEGKHLRIHWVWRTPRELFRIGCVIDPSDYESSLYTLELMRRQMTPGGAGGRTTEAMLSAPPGSYYVWPNGNLHYPKRLAEFLGRNDLKIISHRRFFGEGLWCRGTNVAVVVDHEVSPDNMEPAVFNSYLRWQQLILKTKS